MRRRRNTFAYADSFEQRSPDAVDRQLWEKIEEDKNHYGQWMTWIYRPAIAAFFALCAGLYFGEVYLDKVFDQDNTFDGSPPSQLTRNIDQLESEILSGTTFVATLLIGFALYYLAKKNVENKNTALRGKMYEHLLGNYGIYEKEHLTPHVLGKIEELLRYLAGKPYGGVACAHIVNDVRRIQNKRLPEEEREEDPDAPVMRINPIGALGLAQDQLEPDEPEADLLPENLITRLLSLVGTHLIGEQLIQFWQIAESNLYRFIPMPVWPTLRWPQPANTEHVATALAPKALVPMDKIEQLLRAYWPRYEIKERWRRREYPLSDEENGDITISKRNVSHAFDRITRQSAEQANKLLGLEEENFFEHLVLCLDNALWTQQLQALSEKFSMLFRGAPPLEFTGSGLGFRRKWPGRIEKDSAPGRCGKYRFACLSMQDLRPNLLANAYWSTLRDAAEQEQYPRLLLTTQSALLINAIEFFNPPPRQAEEDDGDNAAALPKQFEPDSERYEQLLLRIMLLQPLMKSAKNQHTLDPARNALLGELIATMLLHYLPPAAARPAEDNHAAIIDQQLPSHIESVLNHYSHKLKNDDLVEFVFNSIHFLSIYLRMLPRGSEYKINITKIALKLIFFLPAKGYVTPQSNNWNKLINLYQHLGDDSDAERALQAEQYKWHLQFVGDAEHNHAISFFNAMEYNPQQDIAVELRDPTDGDSEPDEAADPKPANSLCCSRVFACLCRCCQPSSNAAAKPLGYRPL